MKKKNEAKKVSMKDELQLCWYRPFWTRTVLKTWIYFFLAHETAPFPYIVLMTGEGNKIRRGPACNGPTKHTSKWTWKKNKIRQNERAKKHRHKVDKKHTFSRFVIPPFFFVVVVVVFFSESKGAPTVKKKKTIFFFFTISSFGFSVLEFFFFL